MEARTKIAKELCKFCRTKGLPTPDYYYKSYYYVHKHMDAAGSTDSDVCEANAFLKNLDKFTGIEGNEWKSL